jgi:Dolichyl-phosphate-mannose-protein mannosyltransferase
MTTITTGPLGARPGIPERGGRLATLVRGRPADPRWVRPALLAVLTLTAALYTIALSRSGWANDFYAAAVQAGTKSWKAFFFGSFDASNFITVDKTPAALWVMELSAKAFGLNPWSLLLPQAAEGVATVALLYATVRRWHGPAAGLIAASAAALTPVAALMFRFDNPDALLVLLMTAAAYGTVRAIESGRTRWLVLTGTMFGFAFMAKMLQGSWWSPRSHWPTWWPGRAGWAGGCGSCWPAPRRWSRRSAGGWRLSSSHPWRTGPISAAPRPTACCSSPWATTASAGYRWAAATVGAESAAPLQLASGEPVMAIGGFNGTDSAPALAGFERLVAAGKIHYFVGANQASFGGGSGPAAQITAWVRAHYTAKTVGGVTVYDLARAR